MYIHCVFIEIYTCAAGRQTGLRPFGHWLARLPKDCSSKLSVVYASNPETLHRERGPKTGFHRVPKDWSGQVWYPLVCLNSQMVDQSFAHLPKD